MQSFIVVSGVPASGKSTVGRLLAEDLGWAFLDKDDFLEALFQRQGCVTSHQRHALSRESDIQFESAARELNEAVLGSFWRHPSSSSRSGTPSAWLREPQIRVLEVVCRCPLPVAAKRFVSRTRHSGHQDAAWSEAALIAQCKRIDALLPLGLGTSFEQDTSGTLDLGQLLHVARAWVFA